jgi:hypothetical protein
MIIEGSKRQMKTVIAVKVNSGVLCNEGHSESVSCGIS